MRPAHAELRHVALRLLAIWLILSLGVVAVGPRIAGALLPMFTALIELLQHGFIVTLRLTHDGGEWLIRMQPLIVEQIPLGTRWVIPVGARLDWFSVHVDHTLVPAALFLTAVFAWPVSGLREGLGRLVLSLPVLMVVTGMGAAIHMVGLLQVFLVNLAVARGAAFHEPWLVSCMIFLESGGRWLLPVAAAVACIGAARRLFGTPSIDTVAAVETRPPYAQSATVFPPV